MKRTIKTKDRNTHEIKADAKIEGLAPIHDKNLATTSPDLDAEQRARTWEHGLHEDKLFHDRLNFFSFLESAILGIFGVLYSKQPPAPRSFLFSLAALGIASTFIWLLIQLRHASYLNYLVDKHIKILPEFRDTTEDFYNNTSWWRRVDVDLLLARFIPILFIIVWTLTIIFMIVNA